MMSNFGSLADLGWQTFFQQQLSLDEWDNAIPARVVEQHKSEITVATESNVFNIPLLATMPEMVVGDWLLLDSQQHVIRLLDRKTCFSRKAAGSKLKKQLISTNVDTAFIVSSMNDDFNLNRIERFLSLVNESGAEPVVLLSKSDLSETPQHFVAQIQALDPFLMVEAMTTSVPFDRAYSTAWATAISPSTNPSGRFPPNTDIASAVCLSLESN